MDQEVQMLPWEFALRTDLDQTEGTELQPTTHQPVPRDPDPVPHPRVPPDLLDPKIDTQSDRTRDALAGCSDTDVFLPLCFLPRAFAHENLSLDNQRNLNTDTVGFSQAFKPLSMINVAHFEFSELQLYIMSTLLTITPFLLNP